MGDVEPDDDPPPSLLRRLSATWIVAATILLLVSAVVIVKSVSSDAPAEPKVTPTAVVSTYLRALMSGDASTALAQGQHSGSKKLLDDAVLHRQQQLAPISALVVGVARITGNGATVRAQYRFGSRNADQVYQLTRRGSAWRLNDTTFEIDESTLSNVPSPTIFGRNVSKLTSISVFPGPIEVATRNHYLSVGQADSTRYALSPFDTDATYAALRIAPSVAGLAFLRATTKTYLDNCASAVVLIPGNCPQEENDPKAVNGTAHWTLQSDLTKALSYQSTFDDPTVIAVNGDLTWTCRYSAKPRKRITVTRTDTGIKTQLSGHVDLTSATPRFKPGG